jgi:hypothetical protein
MPTWLQCYSLRLCFLKKLLDPCGFICFHVKLEHIIKTVSKPTVIQTPSNINWLTVPPSPKLTSPKITNLIELFYFLAVKMNSCETCYCVLMGLSLDVRGRRTFLCITPKYICVQRYYPLDLKVRKAELINFKIVACA